MAISRIKGQGWRAIPTSFGDEGRAQMFRKTVPVDPRATMLKLQLPSSFAVLSTIRSPRSAERKPVDE